MWTFDRQLGGDRGEVFLLWSPENKERGVQKDRQGNNEPVTDMATGTNNRSSLQEEHHRHTLPFDGEGHGTFRP